MYDTMVQARPEANMQSRFSSRGDLIANEIKRAILSGRYRAGSALTEKAIAEELGTSKTPVRDALKALSGTGLVTSSSHRGTSVRAVDAPMALAVCDLRLLLEPEAVRRTILRGLDRAAFGAVFERMVAAEDGVELYERSLANRAFHRQLYAGCGNPTLVQVLDDLTDVNALISVTVWAQVGSWSGEAAEHRRMAKDALAGRAEAAAGRLRRHIEVFQQRVVEALGTP
ncbi:MAG: GntR family transcriptional regulator [Acidimicrobiales bacterium]